MYLNTTYDRRWIGRGGRIPWPPRSPDLNPLDFFLWGYMKEQIYERQCRDEQELREKIQIVVRHLQNNPGALRNIRRNFVRRCRLCITAEGRNFEYLF